MMVWDECEREAEALKGSFSKQQLKVLYDVVDKIRKQDWPKFYLAKFCLLLFYSLWLQVDHHIREEEEDYDFYEEEEDSLIKGIRHVKTKTKKTTS